jgi:hypothetical protein
MPASKLTAIRESKKRYFTKINMQIVPKGCMRPQYQDSWGDYWVDENNTLQIRAIAMKNWMHSYYVLLHEFMEAVRCFKKGVSLESIEKHDADNSDHDDPGCLANAPYHKEHMESIMLEQIACLQDGLDFDEYYNSAEPV